MRSRNLHDSYGSLISLHHTHAYVWRYRTRRDVNIIIITFRFILVPHACARIWRDTASPIRYGCIFKGRGPWRLWNKEEILTRALLYSVKIYTLPTVFFLYVRFSIIFPQSERKYESGLWWSSVFCSGPGTGQCLKDGANAPALLSRLR